MGSDWNHDTAAIGLKMNLALAHSSMKASLGNEACLVWSYKMLFAKEGGSVSTHLTRCSLYIYVYTGVLQVVCNSDNACIFFRGSIVSS